MTYRRTLLGLALVVGVAGAIVAAVSAPSVLGPDDGASSTPAVASDSGSGAGTPAPTALMLPRGEARSVSYEDGEERLESAHTQVHHALGTTDEAARLGERAGFANLRPGDPEFASGNRAEWHSVLYSDPGDVMTYAMSYWFPDDWNQYDSTDTFDFSIIFQVHGGDPSDWNPLFGIKIFRDDDEARVGFYQKTGQRGPDTILWSQPLVVEEWVDFAFEVRWSRESDGYLHFYRNGDQVYEAEDLATLPSDANLYAKWGIYGQPARILFDEVRISRGPIEWERVDEG